MVVLICLIFSAHVARGKNKNMIRPLARIFLRGFLYHSSCIRRGGQIQLNYEPRGRPAAARREPSIMDQDQQQTTGTVCIVLLHK